VRLEPWQSTTLTATFAPEGADRLSGAACAYVGWAGEPIDCSASVWTPTATTAATASWWRSWWVLLIAAVALATLVLSLVNVRAGARASLSAGASLRTGPARTAQSGTGPDWNARPGVGSVGGASPDQGLVGRGGEGTRRPPTWVAVVLAVAMVLGLGIAAVAVGGSKLAAAADSGPGNTEGWVGPVAEGPIGTALRENAFEFTAYRFGCEPAQGGGDTCTAVVGLTNPESAPERWHPQMQRLRAGGARVQADAAATRVANGGRDVFADLVAPGHRVLAQLVWTVPDGATPTAIELRSGAFAQGATVTL